MRHISGIGVPLALAGALTLGGCGGTPMYEQRPVPVPPSPANPTSSGHTDAPHRNRPVARTSASSNPATSSPATSGPARATSTPRRSATSRPASTATPDPSRAPRPTTGPTTQHTPASTPAATSPSHSSSSAPAPPRGKPTTLDTMGGPGSGPVLIGGARYPNSFAVSACTIFSSQPTYSFDLGRRYRLLSGVVGQDDDSASRDAVLRLTIRGDGRTLAARTVRYGQRSPVAVTVSGVGRLTLSFTEVSCGSDGAALAFGAARVS